MNSRRELAGNIPAATRKGPASTSQTGGLGTLQYVIILQIVGCVLVVLGHSYPYEGVPHWAEVARRFIYSFHMPLFVWCSGFLAVATGASTKYGLGEFLRKRATRLLLPYVAFSVIGIAPKVLFAQVLNDPMNLGGWDLVVAFLVPRLNVWGHFWFLPMLLVVGLIGYVVDRVARKAGGSGEFVIGAVTLLSAALTFLPDATQWFALSDVQHFLVYFMLGMWTALHRQRIERLPLLVTPFAIALAVVLFIMGGPSLNLPIAVLMIAGLLAPAVWAGRRARIGRDALYAQTYQIFMLSWPFQLVVEILMEQILGVGFAITAPLMFLAGLLLPLITLRLVDRFEIRTGTRAVSLVLGRRG